MSSYIRNGVYTQILSALNEGNCLVVSGVRMSGRSSLIARLAAEGDVLLRPALTVRGIGIGTQPLESIRIALRAAKQPIAPSAAELVSDLLRYVQETDGLLVVDDAHRLDEQSLVQLEYVSAETGRPVLVTTSTSDSRLRRDGRTLFPHAYHLPLPPVGMQEASTLVADTLGGATESGATARILTKSGGVPGLIVAVARDARRTGALREVDGVWLSQRPQWASGSARTVLAMIDELSEPEVEALTRLAIVGTVDGETAEKITGRETLAVLEGHGLLNKQANDENTSRVQVSVHPELLAEHLKNGTELFRRRELFASLSAAIPEPASAGEPGDASQRLLLEDQPSPTMDGNLAAMVQQSIAAQLAVRLDQWQHHRSLRDAIDLLDLLVARGASRDEVRAFLVQASELPARNENELVLFRLREARWRAWLDADPEAAIALLEGVRLTVGDEFTLVLGATSAYLSSMAGLSAQSDESWPTSLRLEYPTMVRPLELLMRGNYQDALIAIPSGPHLSQSVANLAAYARALALTLMGGLDAVITSTSEVLTDAVGRRDPEAVVLMSNVQALQLIMVGRLSEAMTVLTDALALGYTTFPFTPVHVSNLVLLSMLQARRGHRQAAMLTQRLAASFGIRYGALPAASPEVAAAYIDFFSEEEGALDRLWVACSAHLDRGYDAAAVAAWSFAGPWSEERNEEIEEVIARFDGDLFEPVVNFQRAVASRDQKHLVASHQELFDLNRSYFAAVMAVELASRAEEDRDEYQHWFDRALAISRESGISLFEVTRFPMKLNRLSGREREVFDLLTTSESNQNIADQLFISVRTVENHVIRVLRKLELRSRKEVIEVWSQRSY